MGDKSLDGGIAAVEVLDDDGKIIDAAREDFIARVQDVMLLGPGSAYAIIGVAGNEDTGEESSEVNVASEIPGFIIPTAVGSVLSSYFGRDTLEEHQEDYEAFHRIMVDGIWEALANGTNIAHGEQNVIPTSGLTDDIWDPTEVIAAIIAWILEQIPSFEFEIHLPTLIPNIPDIIAMLMLGLPENCSDIADLFSLCSEKDSDEILDDLESQTAENADGDEVSFCELDIFPVVIDIPFPPEFPFEMPELPLPNLAIPGLPSWPDIPAFPLSIDPPGIPSMYTFALEFIVGFPAWLLELLLELPTLILEFILDIMAFIRWVIEKVIEFIMSIFENLAGYFAFAAAMVVVIHDLVVWIVLGSIYYFLGPGMIIEAIAGMIA